MDQQERKRFWEVLCSLQGNDLQSESEKLAKTIMLPRYLYRYRAVSLSSIDALQRNRMYFSTANYYDDPYDTLLHIDFARIHDEGIRVLSSEQMKQQIQNLSSIGIKDSAISDILMMICDSAAREKIIDAENVNT